MNDQLAHRVNIRGRNGIIQGAFANQHDQISIGKIFTIEAVRRGEDIIFVNQRTGAIMAGKS